MTRTFSKVECVCGHPKYQHELAPTPGFRCSGPIDAWQLCSCDGFTSPAKPGKRLVFGVHRIPRRAAEGAPAWAPLDDDA